MPDLITNLLNSVAEFLGVAGDLPDPITYLLSVLALFLALAGVLLFAGWDPWLDPSAPAVEAPADPARAREEVDA